MLADVLKAPKATWKELANYLDWSKKKKKNTTSLLAVTVKRWNNSKHYMDYNNQLTLNTCILMCVFPPNTSGFKELH